ncbi:D-alanyl-D-alanine carboxypeptidase/D-alanyl-D-alanine endopeptidase [Marinitenerispora sediminis]|uniref:D-alanyl-D-alanine carboxypeptidase/D-alanyl-D-alanine-endopeptidase n=1 Tax=Marinitenerispora sediminis TaxID=1931232 RepID=A0A368T5M3_9ACTN|nr:D-alanyl-D-alanine carboxypeptidase/D-alanyl-D-alanine-endopeptidase [Marinitenerispora sediminis]RCV48766.1 D-alanyl-D-alanine carboxypeptidase/D-alanyl-D-alanine-endopeptidase [Marinitenerispora sediminis]RCV50894.1 D-alanyl-D-alanine carboxypeptidase/D-alanyl-D-alanine-endopeptidase [Marinitenerispora sediminis]RCV58672.1 D-alanyl-D-alanine carboxypeptidase/D-alanyl-D-alanine-endopeptidase [Marinitenerispora sediminis]
MTVSPHHVLRRPSPNRASHVAFGLAGTFALLVGTAAPALADTESAGTADLAADIDELLADPALEGATNGVVVRSLSEGDVLYESEPGTALVPASNTKLLTSVAALEVLGTDHRFTTTVSASDQPVGGVVEGDLHLTGGGDPTLTVGRYDELAADVAAAGVTEVTGDLLADDTLFDDQRLPETWDPSDEPYAYAAQVSALTVATDTTYDTGVVNVTVKPGAAAGDPVSVNVSPDVGYVAVEATASTGSADSAAGLSITRESGTNTITVSGSLPAGGGAQAQLTTVDEPTDLAAAVFADALEENGVEVHGEVGRAETPQDAVRIAESTSAELADILVPFLKLSNNGHAEMLVKTIAQETTGEGTWAAGLPEVEAALNRLGLKTEGVELADGSGLTRANKIPAEVITELLAVTREQPWSDTWESALPVAGNPDPMVGGTLASRMVATAAAGNVHAKTGSMTGVSALSGYVTTADGEELVFSILNNGYTGAAPRPIQDAIAVRLAEFSRDEATAGTPEPVAPLLAESRSASSSYDVPEIESIERLDELECTWAGAC